MSEVGKGAIGTIVESRHSHLKSIEHESTGYHKERIRRWVKAQEKGYGRAIVLMK